MKYKAWTVALVGAGLISMPSVVHAEERAQSVVSSLSATTISGYVDTSAQWNLGTGNGVTPSYAFSQGKADGFNLEAVRVVLEKPVEANEGWGSGYKADLFMGPNANFLATQSSGTASDFALKQAYVALSAPVGNGLNFKVGVWDTVIGYEVTDAPNNPNFTRSYGYTIEPSTHTGVQTSYTFNDMLSACFCVANTTTPRINDRAWPARAESYKTYMGSVTFTAPTNWGVLAGSTLTGCVINGFNGAKDQTSYYVGGTINTPVNGLKVGASYDYAGVPVQALGGSSYANAAALYVSYAITDKLTVFGRGEYATSDTGAFIATKVVAATATLQYDLWKNVLSRLEFRWDHAADGTPVYGSEGALKKNSFILLANIAYKF